MVPYDLNCLEQFTGQLCFNWRHEKTHHWTSPVHDRLPAGNAHACCRYSRPDGDAVPVAGSSHCYTVPHAYPGADSNSLPHVFYR